MTGQGPDPGWKVIELQKLVLFPRCCTQITTTHHFPCPSIRGDALSFDLWIPTTQGCDRTDWRGRLANCAAPQVVMGARGHTCTQTCTHLRIPAYTCTYTQVGVGPWPCLCPGVPVCTHICTCISPQAQLHGGFGLPGAWRYSQGKPILWLL